MTWLSVQSQSASTTPIIKASQDRSFSLHSDHISLAPKKKP